MPNSFDTNPRSASHRVMVILGVCFLVVAAATVVLSVKKSKGDLDRIVRVTAELVNVGDGLPDKSDVKFRGVLVGQVSDLVTAPVGQPNIVHIAVNPRYAVGIPSTVTARVVPSNVFAVSSVQLIDNGQAATGLRTGAVIREDTSLPTVLFQSTLTRFREVFYALTRAPDDHSIGVLAALTEATHGRGDRLRETGHDFNEIVAQLNTVVAGDTGPSTISALTDAAASLRDASPELFNALDSAVSPMRTFAEKRTELRELLSAGLHTSGSLADAFEHQTDRLINITSELTPVLGVLGDNVGAFDPIFTRLQRLADNLQSAWNPNLNQLTVKAIVSLTPSRTYIRADCPRYGALEGPSCQTAPEIPTAPALYPALGSMGYPPPSRATENRPNLAPPRDSIRGAPDPLPPPGDASTPGSPLPSDPPLPAEAPVPSPPGPAMPAPEAPVQPQSAVIGGNVGPVGSAEEQRQLGQITGGEANAAVELLLGPVVRGSTVNIVPDPGGDR
jgi:virulence factor Mce-like protein